EADRLDRADDLQPGFLAQLAAGACFRGLIHLQETAGNRPLAGERLTTAADQEHPQRQLDQGEDGQVDRDHRARVLVAVRGWHGIRACATMKDVPPSLILASGVMMSNQPIELPSWTEPDPDAARIAGLVANLAAADGPADAAGTWPEALWRLIQDGGATRWSLSRDFGGEACPRPLLLQRYAQLASGSLTAVFVLSQHDAAV